MCALCKQCAPYLWLDNWFLWLRHFAFAILAADENFYAYEKKMWKRNWLSGWGDEAMSQQTRTDRLRDERKTTIINGDNKNSAVHGLLLMGTKHRFPYSTLRNNNRDNTQNDMIVNVNPKHVLAVVLAISFGHSLCSTLLLIIWRVSVCVCVCSAATCAHEFSNS